VLGLVTSPLAALVPAGADVLAGFELGGPVATALSLATDLPTAFVASMPSSTAPRNLPRATTSTVNVSSSSRT
jgi:hypothetical protein